MLTANKPYLKKYKMFLNDQEANYLVSEDELDQFLESLGWSEIDHPKSFERAHLGKFLLSPLGLLRFERVT